MSLDALLNPILWLLNIVIVAVLTVILEVVMPERLKSKIVLKANKFYKTWISSPVCEIRLSRGFELSEAKPLEDVRDGIAESLNQSALKSGDRFRYEEEKGGMIYTTNIKLEWESTVSHTMPGTGHGMPGTESTPVDSGGTLPSERESEPQRQVEHLRVTVTANGTRYRRLRQSLERTYDHLRDVSDQMPYSMNGRSYSITCDTGEPPLISQFLAELGFQRVSAETEEGLEIQCLGGRVRVRNTGESQLDQVFDRVVQLVTLYG